MPSQARKNNAIRGALGKLIRLGETVNTSLVRECLELILMLADALEKEEGRAAAHNSFAELAPCNATGCAR